MLQDTNDTSRGEEAPPPTTRQFKKKIDKAERLRKDKAAYNESLCREKIDMIKKYEQVKKDRQLAKKIEMKLQLEKKKNREQKKSMLR